MDVIKFSVPFTCAFLITNYIGHHFWLSHNNHARAIDAGLTFIVSFFTVSRLGYYALVALERLDNKRRNSR